MAIEDITEVNFEEKVLKCQTPVLVDFYAVWCGPCKMAEPTLDELSTANVGKISFVKVDVDKNQNLAQKFAVMSIPTTILFKGGKEVGRQTGFSGKEGFEELLKKVN